MLALGRRAGCATVLGRLRPRQLSVSCSLQKPPNQAESQSYKSIQDGDPMSSHGFKPFYVRQVSRVPQQLERELQPDPVPAVVQDGKLRKNSKQIKVSCEHCGKSLQKCNLNRHLKTCSALKKKTLESIENSKPSELEAEKARTKHEKQCKLSLPLETQSLSSPTEIEKVPEVKTTKSTNRNWFEKVDELKESIGMKAEVLESYFDLMVNSPNNVLDEAFEEFTNLKSNPNVKVNLNTINNYNTFLRGFARECDFKQIQELWKEMEELNLKPGLSSYISILLSFHDSDPNSSVYHKAFNTLYADFEKAGYTLDQALHHGDFLLKDRSRFMKSISMFLSENLSSYVPVQHGNNSPLVEKLKGMDSSKLTSQVEDLMESERLRKALKDQLDMESKLLVPIPSICKTESSKVLKTFTDKLLAEWEENVMQEIDKKYRWADFSPIWETGSRVRYNNFLTFLSPEKLTEIILSKAVTMLTSDGFSEPISFIRADLGDSVMDAYHMSIKTEEDSFQMFRNGMDQYFEWFCNPQGKESTHRDALAKAMCEVSIGGKMKKWPKSLKLTLGDELLKILFKCCQVRKDVNDNVILDGKYLTVEHGEWSEKMLEEGAKGSLHPAFFKIFRKRKANFDVEELKPNPALFELFSASSRMDLTFPPEDLPMLVPPLPWTSCSSGGYITKTTPLIKYPDIGFSEQEDLINSSPPGSINPVLDSLNQLGSVAWKVNKPVLNLAVQLFTDPQPDRSLLYELDIPLHKDHIGGEPTLKENIKETLKRGQRLSEEQKMEYRNYHSYRQKHAKLKEEIFSLWCSALYRLSLAKHFQDAVLWFPHNVDFRGRCYPIPSQLNHMGADLARSLLVFARGKKLGPNGFYWLKLHCINLTGTLKRESIDTRIAHVDSILDKILDSARDPLNGERWWLESDDPWQTLSACIEIKNALEHPGGVEDYTCHLPIHQDGSCNGLQHYAALGRDRLGAEAVNLVPAEKPGDVYSLIANIVEEKREMDSKEGNEIARILEGHIKRKVVKQTVMTTVYGVTKFGARLQIKKQLKDLRDFPIDSIDDASKYVASKTFDSLNEVFESSQRIQAWLTSCAGVISKDDKSQVSWVTPLGFPVVQPYYKVRYISVN